ncbi:hypothetical protein JOQ06_008073, partial [Pogonophryne albipinna]
MVDSFCQFDIQVSIDKTPAPPLLQWGCCLTDKSSVALSSSPSPSCLCKEQRASGREHSGQDLLVFEIETGQQCGRQDMMLQDATFGKPLPGSPDHNECAEAKVILLCRERMFDRAITQPFGSDILFSPQTGLDVSVPHVCYCRAEAMAVDHCEN